jgi:hypothetical protein
MSEMIAKEDVAQKVVDVSQMVAEGYRRAEGGNDACATAASNTGVWILEALGFNMQEIRAMVDAHRRAALNPSQT